MTGSIIVNNLAGLMMITSLLGIGAKRPVASCWFYALQSLVLVAIFATLSQTLDAPLLGMWAITAFATKVVLVPLIMGYAFRKLSDPTANGGVISPAWLMLAAAVIVVLCWFVVEPVKLPMVADLKPALAVSLGHFMLGLLCIVTQRNILKQAFGYCLMENGSHLTLALLAYKAPELVESIMQAGRNEGVQQERARMKALDDICDESSRDIIAEAKYGETPMSAPEAAMAILPQMRNSQKASDKNDGANYMTKRKKETSRMSDVKAGESKDNAPARRDEDEIDALAQMMASAQRRY